MSIVDGFGEAAASPDPVGAARIRADADRIRRQGAFIPRRSARTEGGRGSVGAWDRCSSSRRARGPIATHRRAREQQCRDVYAAFIDRLVAAGFIALAGPLPDEGGAVLVVRADADAAVRERLASDPWYEHGILALERIRRWEVFIDRWAIE